jgi:sporulation-control protein spo0M
MKDEAEWLVIKPDFQDPYHVVTHPLMLKLLSALEAKRQELEDLQAAKEGAK